MRIEVWAALEASANDPDDAVEHLASLGVHAVRQPFPWHRVAPADARACRWSDVDAVAARYRARGVRPIAELRTADSSSAHGARIVIKGRAVRRQ